jgi:cytochrome c-type biogenesis protein CcmH
MKAERLLTSDRNLVGLQSTDLIRGESRDPLVRVPCGYLMDPGLRRDDHFSLFRRFGERRQCSGIRLSAWLLLIVAIVLVAIPAHAVRPDEMLADPALEARARDIGRELRCLVCRNQSIDDSDADLARDLRVLVRERLKEGHTDDQVIAYVRSRYGDFVLLRPPFAVGTVLLWVGPLLILLLGAFGVARFYRARARVSGPATAALSPEEGRRLQAVLGEET